MRKIALAALALLLCTLIAVPAAFAQAPPPAAKKDHSYIGTDGCKLCHKVAAKGDQYGKWLASPHAKAYAVLADPKAKEVAAKAGVTGDPQQSEKCLSCHVTACGVKSELIGLKFKKEDGVGCESCHGPGSDYKDISTMKDKAKAIAAGLVMPTEATCKTCHNEKSPTYKPFDFAKMSAVIAHPYPKAAEAKPETKPKS
jgi:hypothetical protein